MAQQIVDVSAAVKLRVDHGLSYQQIADLQGCSKQAIHAQLSKIIPEKSLIEQFKESRANILANAQLKVLRAFTDLDDDETKDMIKRRGMVDMGILYDKEALETGRATQNIHVITEDIAALKGLK